MKQVVSCWLWFFQCEHDPSCVSFQGWQCWLFDANVCYDLICFSTQVTKEKEKENKENNRRGKETKVAKRCTSSPVNSPCRTRQSQNRPLLEPTDNSAAIPVEVKVNDFAAPQPSSALLLPNQENAQEPGHSDIYQSLHQVLHREAQVTCQTMLIPRH